MAKAENEGKSCCYTARKHLMEDLRQCDMCSTSWEEHHKCLGRAAKRSGTRARTCMKD